MRLNYIFLVLFLSSFFMSMQAQPIEGRWSVEKANRWYERYDWLAGTNFNPSTAINQLEMWQAETFDLETIERELKWSAELGFNLHRVYLHNLVWQQNSEAFLNRLDQYLAVADKYEIKTMLVLLDDVWDPMPALGKQRDPIKGLHNSGWVQAPGREYLEDESKHPLIEAYVKGVLQRFKNDNRVLAWDLYNEPGNSNDNSYGQTSRHKTELPPSEKDKYTLVLVKKVFKWAREIDPSQPLTMGIWRGDISKWGSLDELPPLDRVMIENSDVITFHAYDSKLEEVKQKINLLRNYNRPIICTEYMARTNNNLFKDLMPLFKKENIGAINWGFVSGKTNTIYPWKTWEKAYDKEPEVWFHDILRKDGTPFSQEEVALIKSLTN
jgi:hypothetical protein